MIITYKSRKDAETTANMSMKGRIKHLALTNFDTEHLRIITEQGTRIVSNQVQYS
jgi:diketogulonate reductase-like aldo/keto reductase